MVLASADPPWLHVIGLIAGTLLVLELLAALFLVLVISVGLAGGLWWVRRRVTPILGEYTGKINQVMETAGHSTDRVVQGVAEFHGRTRAVETIVKVLLFGRKGAEVVPVVPPGSAQRGVRTVRGMNGIEGYAPQYLPTNPELSTRSVQAGDLTPLTPATTTSTTSGQEQRLGGTTFVVEERGAHNGHNGHRQDLGGDHAAPPPA